MVMSNSRSKWSRQVLVDEVKFAHKRAKEKDVPAVLSVRRRATKADKTAGAMACGRCLIDAWGDEARN
jgi:hypothetical protein